MTGDDPELFLSDRRIKLTLRISNFFICIAWFKNVKKYFPVAMQRKICEE